MQTAGKGWPTLRKKLDSSGRVPRVAHHTEGVHLQVVVVVEAERLMELAPGGPAGSRAGFQTLAAAGMAGVEDGHVVVLGQMVDGGEQVDEVLLGVDVLLPVGGQAGYTCPFPAPDALSTSLASIFSRLACSTSAMGLPVTKVRSFGGALGVQITAGVLGIAQVHVGRYGPRCGGWSPPAGTRPSSGCPPPCGRWECAAAWRRWRTGSSWCRPEPAGRRAAAPTIRA